jgi:hypothetical protein
MLSDLRESGQIEQDADMVCFCYRPEYYEIDNYEVGNESFETDGLFLLIVAKHRNGELGEIPLRFIKEQTRLTNYSHSNFEHFEPMNVELSRKNSTFVQEETKQQIKNDSETISYEDNLFNADADEDEIPF